MSYRADIDGLRAVAVTAVVLHHAGFGCTGGYVGVDVFLVLSGFLIGRQMASDVADGTFSLVSFWERRCRRILPALCVVVAASLVGGWFLLVPRAYQMLGRSIVSLTTIRANVFFARHTDYFSPSVHDAPLLHTWSLAVEEQFYLFVPLVFWGAMRLRRRSWLGPAAVLSTVSGFVYAALSTADAQSYYRLSTRLWEPLVGVLVALYAAERTISFRPLRELAAAAALAAIVVPCLAYDAKTPFPGPAALPPVMGTALLIVAGAADPRGSFVHRLLASKPAVAFGLVSYSFYLWHWPLLVFLRQYAAAEPTIAARTAGLVVAGLLAWISFRFVEQPFRRRLVCATQFRLFACSAAALVALLAAGQSLRWTDGAVDRLPEQARRFARTGVQMDCYNRRHAAADVPHGLLRVGADGVAPRVLVWGDSHAMAVLPAIDEACRAAGISARCAVAPSRPPVVRHVRHSSMEEWAAANAFGAAVLRHATSDEVEVVLLAGLWSSYFGEPEFETSLAETIEALHRAGKKVFYLRDVPVYPFDVAAELISTAWRDGDLGRLSTTMDDYHRQNRLQDRWLPAQIERGLEVLDPIPRFQSGAGNSVVPAYDAEGSYYSDANHLSAYGARRLRALFTPMVAAAQNDRQPLLVADRIGGARR